MITDGDRMAVDGFLLVFHRPAVRRIRDASTVMEHVAAFERHTSLVGWNVNTDLGFPPGLASLDFRWIVLHYSLFGLDGYRLDRAWLAYLRSTPGTKIAFFQDECTGCQQRFRFLNDLSIECVYTCLEPSEFDKVYRRFTDVDRLESTLPGYVSDELVEAARRFGVPDTERTTDVGYRARPLPAYLGRGAMEKHEIGIRFKELAAGTGLRLDIAGGEDDRLYGDDWHRFMAGCRCMLGVESGASAFDLEGEVLSEYRQLIEQGRRPGVDDLRTLSRWEEVVHYRTISPRHFEAAAFRVCQILFEGAYSQALSPMVHYIPLKKDFSNVEEVIRLAKDREVRAELTGNAHRDLIESDDWTYRRFIRGFDSTLCEIAEPPSDPVSRPEATAALDRGARGRRLRRRGEWALLRALQTAPLRPVVRGAGPLAARVRRRLGIRGVDATK
jgi:hypothetical protein